MPPTAGGDEGVGQDEGEPGDGQSTPPPPPLKGLCASVTEAWDSWTSWADGGDVWEAKRVPGGFFADAEGATESGGGATAFQRLLLVKAFREDQLLRCIAKFVGEKLGSSFAERYGGVCRYARLAGCPEAITSQSHATTGRSIFVQDGDEGLRRYNRLKMFTLVCPSATYTQAAVTFVVMT